MAFRANALTGLGVVMFWLLAVAFPEAAAAGPYRHVFVVVLENTDYDDAMRQPYFKELSERGAVLGNYQALVHPSQPNYIAMIAGSTYGLEDLDDPDGTVDLDGNHLGDLLEAKGLNWHVYAEGYRGGPDRCYLEDDLGAYARKHVPFLSFRNIQHSTARCANISGTDGFAAIARAGQLASYTLYIPDLNDDGHDTSVKHAASWLKDTFGPLLENEKFMADMLFVVTFDEGRGLGAHDPSRVATILVGKTVVPGSVSMAPLTHYSLLKLIEDNFELGNLGQGDAAAPAIDGNWTDH